MASPTRKRAGIVCKAKNGADKKSPTTLVAARIPGRKTASIKLCGIEIIAAAC
jgi:hypothetical protein